MERPFLIGRLVYLRPLQSDDAEHFAEWLNDARVTRTLRARGPITIEAEREWIARVTRDPAHMVCALVRRRDDRMIGSAGLHGIDTQARSAEYGIHIGIPAMWGKGYGTETTRLLLEHAFRTMNLHRVWLRTHADNHAGLRAYEKAGFGVEGVQRDAVFRDGGYKDMVLMAILRPDWERSIGEGSGGRGTPGRGKKTRGKPL
jgi:[ribosomal protein S5]-alanine N-acetyltransferase